MRIVRKEFGHNYESYSFGYTFHAYIDKTDDLSSVYGQGLLPYSAQPSTETIFYMARSVRTSLSSWNSSSENRRVYKKYSDTFTKKILSHEELKKNAELRELFLRYFKERHGEMVMSQVRYEGILSKELPLRAVCYYKENILVAFVLEVVTDSLVHFWFSCYELAYIQTSLGMYLILDSIMRAKEDQKDYFYLGTAYGKKATYKMNIETLEFWDGTTWQKEVRMLKEKTKEDTLHEVSFDDGFNPADL
jgi:arginyl-tRNA--protein-N-Asp/Glu arginylyltransferase